MLGKNNNSLYFSLPNATMTIDNHKFLCFPQGCRVLSWLSGLGSLALRNRIMATNQAHSALIDKIFDRDGGHCIYCGDYAAEVDHVIPRKDNGPAKTSNLVCVCTHCNRIKRNHPEDFEAWLRRGICWLILKGEDIDWMDDFYT